MVFLSLSKRSTEVHYQGQCWMFPHHDLCDWAAFGFARDTVRLRAALVKAFTGVVPHHLIDEVVAAVLELLLVRR